MKIGRLEQKLEGGPGTDGQTGGRADTDKTYKSEVFDIIPFKQKKNFENRTVRTEIESKAWNARTERRSGRETNKKYTS